MTPAQAQRLAVRCSRLRLGDDGRWWLASVITGRTITSFYEFTPGERALFAGTLHQLEDGELHVEWTTDVDPPELVWSHNGQRWTHPDYRKASQRDA